MGGSGHGGRCGSTRRPAAARGPRWRRGGRDGGGPAAMASRPRWRQRPGGVTAPRHPGGVNAWRAVRRRAPRGSVSWTASRSRATHAQPARSVWNAQRSSSHLVRPGRPGRRSHRSLGVQPGRLGVPPLAGRSTARWAFHRSLGVQPAGWLISCSLGVQPGRLGVQPGRLADRATSARLPTGRR
jgi:hypothetical protein